MQHPSILTENALTTLAVISEKQPPVNLTVVKVMLQALHNQLLQSISSSQDMGYWDGLSELAAHVLQETRQLCGSNSVCRPLLADLEKLARHIRLIIQQGCGVLLQDAAGCDWKPESSLSAAACAEGAETARLAQSLYEYRYIIQNYQAQITELKALVGSMQRELRQHIQVCAAGANSVEQLRATFLPNSAAPQSQSQVQSQAQAQARQARGAPAVQKFQQPAFNTDSRLVNDDFLRNLK